MKRNTSPEKSAVRPSLLPRATRGPISENGSTENLLGGLAIEAEAHNKTRK